jgi:hypothetical protein
VPPERFDELLDARCPRRGARRAVAPRRWATLLVDLDKAGWPPSAPAWSGAALLAEAGDLGEVVQIEAELTRRTADLESLQARRAALGEQVALSTVVLRLQGDDGDDVVAGAPGFLDGLRGGWGGTGRDGPRAGHRHRCAPAVRAVRAAGGVAHRAAAARRPAAAGAERLRCRRP